MSGIKVLASSVRTVGVNMDMDAEDKFPRDGSMTSRNVPAAVMTGDTRSQTVDSISEQGVSVLIKPFLAEELLEALKGQEKRE
jgi:hypothetical protein